MQLSQTIDKPAVSLPFKLPPTQGDGVEPTWNGKAFLSGTKERGVLHYGSTDKGWSDSLTDFHEENAGSNHFIDAASRNHALNQVLKFTTASSPTILEIGCSSGFMLELLKNANPDGVTIGSDIVDEPLERLAKRLPGIPLLRFDVSECPLPNECIDAVVALNVLEHIEDDRQAAKQLFRILKPGGIAVLEVPAGPELYDDFDRLLMHYRRYTMRGLQSVLKNSGFTIEYASHLGCFIYPGFWAVKQLGKLKPTSAKPDEVEIEKKIKRTASSVPLEIITQLELAIGKTLRFPFGIRCLVTCRKPS